LSSLRRAWQSGGRQTHSATWEARGIVIAGVTNHLQVDHRGEAIGRWVGYQDVAGHCGQFAVRQCFGEYAPDELAFIANVELHQLRDRAAEIGVAGRRRIDKSRFEVGSLHRHEIPGVRAAERAVHALALLQHCIGDLDRAQHRLPAYRVEGAEIDRNCWMRRDGASFKCDVVEGQRTGEFSELRIDEEAADVVLREERIDDLPCDGLVAVRNGWPADTAQSRAR
jgi:hypothetical protein